MLSIVKLDIDKIKKELERIDKNQSWLAVQLKCTRANVSSIFKRQPITYAEPIGKILNIQPKDLIK
jgi:transcriptional regulator